MHPLVRAAGERGELPGWAVCVAGRRDHLRGVAELLGKWAAELELAPGQRVRWRAAGWLHDALRDAEPTALRESLELDWPPAILHGPACARRLEEAGVEDAELLRAVAYHSVGHPELGRLGIHLYMADFLDPGRGFLPEERRRLRERVPREGRSVLVEVVALRLRRLIRGRQELLPESVAFWNACLDGIDPREDASEREREAELDGGEACG